MTAKGHLLFAISCSILAKNIGLTTVLTYGDWWHIIPSAILSCLLPDIDHPRSFIGRKLKYLSKMISYVLGHRGFTHSLLAIFTFRYFFYFGIVRKWNIISSPDIIHGLILGYISHIIADSLTPFGVQLIWPCKRRLCLPILILKLNKQLEILISTIIFLFAILIPKKFIDKDIVFWLSKINIYLLLALNYIGNYFVK